MNRRIGVVWAILFLSCGEGEWSRPDVIADWATVEGTSDDGSDIGDRMGIPEDAHQPEEGPPPDDLPSAEEALEDGLQPLSITGVWPGRGLATGGETVTVSGEGFVSGLVVVFDQSASPSVVVVDSRTALVRTPPHPPGTVSVSALRPDGASAVLEGAFTYGNRVAITSVEPRHISIRGGTPITVTGAGFAGGARVLVAGRLCPVITVVDDSRLLAVTPEGERPGPADLIVVAEMGQATLLGGLVYDDEPYQVHPDIGISWVTPASGPASGGTPIEVLGAGFAQGAQVFVGGLPATGVQVVAVDRIRAVTPPGSPGPATVLVKQGDAEAALLGGFAYEAPTSLLAVHPDQGATAGGTLVSLFGTGFPSEARVFFGEAEASHVVVASKTRITCRTPQGSEGAVDVRVLAGGQIHVLEDAFTYFDPTGLYGGTWGGPVQGTLNVTVLDASAGGPLADAYVIVGNDPTTPYQGYTGPDGVITFSGVDLEGPLTVSASKDCYNNASIVAFDAQNVTLYLQYVCPTPGGFPPGVAPGRISGRVLGLGKYVLPPPGNCWLLGVGEDWVSCLPCWSESWCAPYGASCVPIGDVGTFCAKPCLKSADCLDGYVCTQVVPGGGAHCIPEPGPKTAICKTTQPDIFTEAPDPGKQSEVDADLAYSILVRPGDLAVVCLGGFRDAMTNEFKPYAMGVKRHVHVNPGEKIAGLDILLNIPMDRRFRVYLDQPPSGPGGPDFNYVLVYYDFKSDGVFQDTWSIPYAFGDSQVVVETQPRAFVGELADVTYTFLAGAFSLTADNTPFSVALHQDVSDLQDDTMFRLDGSTASVVRTGVRRDVYGMWGWADDAFFAVGQDGMVLYHDGSGFSAQPVEGATGATLRAVAGAGTGFAVAVGDAGEVVRFDGTSWRREPVEVAWGRSLTGIACRAPDDCFAVAYGFAMHWDGTSWASIPVVPAGSLNGVASVGPRQAVAVGSSGRILRLDPSGSTVETSGTGKTLQAVCADSAGTLWAVGDQGVVLRKAHLAWKVLDSGTQQALHAVACRKAGAVAVGDAGTVVLLDADGKTAVLKVAGYAPHLRAAFAAPKGPVFAMGVSQLLLGPFLQVPRVLYPPDGGLLTEPRIEVAANPGIPASMHYFLVAIPGLMGDIPVWEFIASGDTFRLDLPDFENLEGTPGIPRGTPLKLIVIRSLIPGFTMDHFDFSDLSPFEQSAWAVDITTFTRP